MPLRLLSARGDGFSGPVSALLAILLLLLLAASGARAADLTPLPPATAVRRRPWRPRRAPTGAMSSAGPLGHFAMRLEREAMSDISMLPDTPGALVRQWRSFDRNGSALGALINVGWVAAGGVPRACWPRRRCVWGLSRRVRRRMRLRPEGPTVPGLLLLLLCDAIGARGIRSRFFLQPPLADGCRAPRSA